MNNQVYQHSNTSSSYLFGYCEYTGTSDMYPKKYRNLINNENSKKAAIKIQQWWKSSRVKTTPNNERFTSWFGI